MARPKYRYCLRCGQSRKVPEQFNNKYTLYCTTCKPNTVVVHPLRVAKVDLEKQRDMLLTCLSRETENLMIASRQGSLSKDQSTSLIAYLKLVTDLRAQDMLEDAIDDTTIPLGVPNAVQAKDPA